MDLIVESAVSALWGASRFRCAVGRNGIIAVDAKREGDGKTPVGRWPIREILYRADRVEKPVTKLPIRPLDKDDAWCEIPTDPAYNTSIRHSQKKGSDSMWREDNIFDVIGVLGYNDNPVVPGAGSAIWLHVARPDFSPSAGCVTLRLTDLLAVLRQADKDTCVDVRPS